MTSDEYIMSMKDKFNIIHIKYKPITSFADKITKVSSKITNKFLNKFAQKNYDDSIFK